MLFEPLLRVLFRITAQEFGVFLEGEAGEDNTDKEDCNPGEYGCLPAEALGNEGNAVHRGCGAYIGAGITKAANG